MNQLLIQNKFQYDCNGLVKIQLKFPHGGSLTLYVKLTDLTHGTNAGINPKRS